MTVYFTSATGRFARNGYDSDRLLGVRNKLGFLLYSL
jgi:hypothetical protein